MAAKPTVRWNESKQRWMAWVRFADGTRRKVERREKAEAQRDLDRLLELRAQDELPDPKREKLASFNQVLDAWLAAGCPTASPTRRTRHATLKSPNTIDNARTLLAGHVRPVIGKQRIDRTSTERLERVFGDMAEREYATSTIDRTWGYLNQALEFGRRQRLHRSNPASDVLLPAARPPKRRKAVTLEQVEAVLTEAIPADPRPAMWLTGLMCGLRPGELAGLRWPFVDLDSTPATLRVEERIDRVGERYVGQAAPKTERGKRRMDLHPLVVAALGRHREELRLLGLYDPEGFVFPTRNGTPQSLSNMRRDFSRLCSRAGLGDDWTTYEMRHSFVSLVSEHLDDLVKVADLVGHVDTRTTQGYRHRVRPSLPHAVEAWDRLLGSVGHSSGATAASAPSEATDVAS